MPRTRGPWKHRGSMVYAPRDANICEVSEPRASNFVQHERVRLGSLDAAEAFANAEIIAMVPDLVDAGNTLAAYVYSILNPGEIPTTVKSAMRVFEEAGKI